MGLSIRPAAETQPPKGKEAHIQGKLSAAMSEAIDNLIAARQFDFVRNRSEFVREACFRYLEYLNEVEPDDDRNRVLAITRAIEHDKHTHQMHEELIKSLDVLKELVVGMQFQGGAMGREAQRMLEKRWETGLGLEGYWREVFEKEFKSRFGEVKGG